MVGYVISAVLTSTVNNPLDGWRYALIFQACCLSPFPVFFVLAKDYLINTRGMSGDQRIAAIAREMVFGNTTLASTTTTSKEEENTKHVTHPDKGGDEKKAEEEDGSSQQISVGEEESLGKQQQQRVHAHTAIFQLLSNPLWLLLTMALTALFFVSTGIQFWSTDYVRRYSSCLLFLSYLRRSLLLLYIFSSSI